LTLNRLYFLLFHPFSRVSQCLHVHILLQRIDPFPQKEVLFENETVLALQLLLPLNGFCNAFELFPTFCLYLGPAVEKFIQVHSRAIVFFGVVPIFDCAFKPPSYFFFSLFELVPLAFESEPFGVVLFALLAKDCLRC
jgi:hypothetical protein